MQQRIKYPRTYHLPFSDSLQSDDKQIPSLDKFINQEVVVTVKMDGENTTMYSDGYLHARSIDSKSNWTRSVAKSKLAKIKNDIPQGFRLCCENLYAKHSIYYPEGYLDDWVYLLSVWTEDNLCLSWEDTLIYSELLDLPTPKVLYKGIWNYSVIKSLVPKLDTALEEGFVVRLTQEIGYTEFSECFAKYVRAGHVQDNADHWLKTAVPNGRPKKS